MTKTKQQLLQELATYVHLDSGRKIRADKDKQHSSFVQTKLAIYNRLKNKLSNRKAREDNLLLSFEFDENGFYLPIPEEYTNKNIEYKQEFKGRTIYHTVQRVRTQMGIDLEKYRFEAWRELAMSDGLQSVVPPNQDLNGFLFVRYGMTPEEAEAATLRRRPTWAEIFSEVYHVEQNEIKIWSYEEWRRYYDIVPSQLLPDDFIFVYGKEPGTEDFHPEWAYKRQERIDLEAESKESEARRRAEQFISNMRKGE